MSIRDHIIVSQGIGEPVPDQSFGGRLLKHDITVALSLYFASATCIVLIICIGAGVL